MGRLEGERKKFENIKYFCDYFSDIEIMICLFNHIVVIDTRESYRIKLYKKLKYFFILENIRMLPLSETIHEVFDARTVALLRNLQMSRKNNPFVLTLIEQK